MSQRELVPRARRWVKRLSEPMMAGPARNTEHRGPAGSYLQDCYMAI